MNPAFHYASLARCNTPPGKDASLATILSGGRKGSAFKIIGKTLHRHLETFVDTLSETVYGSHTLLVEFTSELQCFASCAYHACRKQRAHFVKRRCRPAASS